MPTLDCFAHRIGVGLTTRKARTTATAMVVVIEGEGESRIGDKTFNWKQHDVFTLPRWQWIRAHGDARAGDAVPDDRPRLHRADRPSPRRDRRLT